MIYADVIVDIAQGNLDRVFQYRIPASLEGKLEEGSPVMIPFGKGNRLIKGYEPLRVRLLPGQKQVPMYR